MSDENKQYATCPDCGEIPGPAHWDYDSPCPRALREKEANPEHVDLPRQNELPAPMMWADEPPEFTKWLRDKCNGDYDDVEVRLVRQYPIRAMQIGWQAATDFWKANQTAPLSDDVKAVEKEGDSGLKEASEHSTHVLQNALKAFQEIAALYTTPIISDDRERFLDDQVAAAHRIATNAIALLSEHDGKQGAAPSESQKLLEEVYEWLTEPMTELGKREYFHAKIGQFLGKEPVEYGE